MKQSSFNSNLAIYRKRCGFTQERLAQLLSVTPQAVSKWEKGGYPDSGLLPKISEVLHVSLDVLFGLKPEADSIDLAQELIQEIRSYPKEKRSDRVMELCYCMLYAYQDNLPADCANFPQQFAQETYAQLRTDYELALARLNPDMQYLYFHRIPVEGTENYVHITKQLLELFHLLADKNALRIIFFAETLPRNFILTKECLSQKLNLPLSVVSNLVDRLDRLGIMWELTADTGNASFSMYGYVHNVALCAILTLATSLTNYIAYRELDIDIWNKGPFHKSKTEDFVQDT